MEPQRRAALIARGRALVTRLAKFGVVGGVAYVIDVTVFNVLRFAGPGLLEHKPLTAKGISVAVATMVTYAGNRHWTWVDRARSGARREVTLFFALNGVGMVIAVAILAVSHYVLGLRSPLEDNISGNVVGLVAGMIFRFWSYRRFVFRPASEASSDTDLAPQPADGVPDGEAETSVHS